jgi:hypothetical protein
MKLHKYIYIIFLLVLSLPAVAGKMNIMGGMYSVTASTDDTEGSLSNFGTYKFQYGTHVYGNIEAGIGYTLIMSDAVGGDLIYGLDIGINYFPVTPPTLSKFLSNNINIKVEEMWRPYLSFGFHQREVQSVKVSYAGIGVGVGMEGKLTNSLSFVSELRYITLAGANNGEANELEAVFGVSIAMW